MEEYNFDNLLKTLNKINPPGKNKPKTKIHTIHEKARNLAIGTLAIIFAILFLTNSTPPFAHSQSISELYIVITILSIIAIPTTIIIIIIIYISFFIYKYHKKRPELITQEFQNHKSNIEKITIFDRETLEDAKEFLKIKNSTREDKISIFFVGTEKIAIFGVGWIVLETFFNKDDLGIINGSLYLLVLFSTIIIVGIFLHNYKIRHHYHIQIIEMALKKKPKIN